jgi:hypothetical protein
MKLEDCLNKEINVYLKESTAYFSGRNCDLDHITEKYSNLLVKLKDINEESILGEEIEVPFHKCTYQDISFEAKSLIRKYKCTQTEILTIKYNDEMVYKNA